MALFNFGKKKEEEKKAPTCCCSGAENKQTETSCCCSGGEDTKATSTCCGETVEGICCIKVLGAGCKSCHEQYENAKAAVTAMGLNVEVEYITDMEKVMTYGVMRMPAIVVNEQIAAMGKVLKTAEVEALLRGFQK